MFKKYPFVKQEGIKDCGVASLQMIIKYYKGQIPMELLRELIETTKSGTTAYHLVEGAKTLGFDCRGIKCESYEEISNKILLPAIAHVTIDETYNHYVVIYEIDKKKKKILVADPASKMKKMSFDDFNDIWNNILIIMYPVRNLPFFKNKYTTFPLILKLLKNSKKELINMLLLSLFLTAFSIFTSFYFKYIIDGISYMKTKEYFLFIFFIFLSVYILKIITDFFRNKILIYFNQKTDAILTTQTFKQIILLPYNYYCNRSTGEIISRINDLNAVREVISKVAYTLFIDLPLTLFAFLFLLFVSSKLFLIAFLLLLFYILNVIIFRPLFKKYINLIQEKKGEVTSYMVESISGFETVKGANIEEKVIKKFEYKYAQLLVKLKKFEEIINYQYLFKELINNIGFLLIIYYGSILVINHELTIGQLLTFNALLAYFLGPIRNVIDLDSSIREAKNAIKRILELFYEQKDNGVIKNAKPSNVKIRNLNYTYNDRNYILKNISLEIKESEKVLIIGKSGSGKSTLLKILMKYYKVNRGQVFINDIDINDYNRKNYKEKIAYVSQNEMLFTDTLEGNLCLNNDDKGAMLEIAKICEVDKIIKNINTGYKTLIEENGNNISGGEKQRIVLARILLKPFELLIIDEGLNQMDIQLERRVLTKIMDKYSDKTIIVVTHRMENMDLFDKIIEIKDGCLKRIEVSNV